MGFKYWHELGCGGWFQNMQNSNVSLGVWSVNKKVINGFLQNMANFIENNHG